MSENVIHLTRPRDLRRPAQPLGLYLRIGYNQHVEMLDLMAEGLGGFLGLIIEAHNAVRHKELCAEARKRGFDVILDPKVMNMALVGGHNQRLAELPWGAERPHRVEDFEGVENRIKANEIAKFAIENQFTQVLGPTHLLSQGANDPWLRKDVAMMGEVRTALDAAGANNMPLIYELVLPMQVFKDELQRQAIIQALGDAPSDAIWLKVENFDAKATGAGTTAYIEAVKDFHVLGKPIVADHVGGLPGLALLSFGAVGGIAHGVTMHEGFRAYHLRKPPIEGRTGMSPQPRVYFPNLDMMLKPSAAKDFLNSSTRIKGRFGCRDSHCCPHGVRDMIERPARHFVYQRTNEIAQMSGVPTDLRVGHYLDKHVRRVSDDVASVAASKSISDEIKKKLTGRQQSVSRFRQAMAHLAEVDAKSIAESPLSRAARESGQK